MKKIKEKKRGGIFLYTLALCLDTGHITTYLSVGMDS